MRPKESAKGITKINFMQVSLSPHFWKLRHWRLFFAGFPLEYFCARVSVKGSIRSPGFRSHLDHNWAWYRVFEIWKNKARYILSLMQLISLAMKLGDILLKVVIEHASCGLLYLQTCRSSVTNIANERARLYPIVVLFTHDSWTPWWIYGITTLREVH